MLAAAVPAASAAPDDDVIAMRQVPCRVRILTTAQAAESQTISNPLHWPQITEIVADGAWVEQQQPIVWFDPTGPSNALLRLLQQQCIGAAELRANETEADNRLMDLDDRLQGVRDRLAVEMARQERLRSLPDPDEVALATGALRVEELAAGATSNDLQRAARRLADKLIAPAAFEKLQAAHQEAQAHVDRTAALLALARRPVTDDELEQAARAITNLQLEAANLTRQREDTRRITALRQQAAEARTAMLDRQIGEQVEALGNTRLRAPISGYFSYLREFRRRILAGGDRMWRNFAFAAMPQVETLALKGAFDESLRRFFEVGDPVEIRFVGRLDQPSTGRVVAIGEHARDRTEKTEMQWGGDAESGLKVYDVTIRPDVRAPWMSLGMHAECELTARQPLAAPAVAADRVFRRGGNACLVIDGRMTPVSGTVVDGWFVLSETNWLGHRVSSDPLPVATDGPTTFTNALFETSGELVPARMTDATLKRIHGWQKVAWLIAEDSVVTGGTVVARLDEKEILEQINEWEQRLAEARSNREAQEESLALAASQTAFQLAIQSNAVRIAELDWLRARAATDEPALIEARLQAQLAAIHLAAMQRDLETIQRRPAELRAPQERLSAERALQRARLQDEQARLRLAELEEGPDPLLVARARDAHTQAALTLHTATLKAEADGFRARTDLWRAVRHADHMRKQLELRRTYRANLALQAPCDGVVRYNRTWYDGAFVKVKPGVMLGSSMVPVRIADAAHMEIRAELPERFYRDVRPGLAVSVQIPAVTDIPLRGTVVSVDYLFEDRRQTAAAGGLYSAREPLGETVGYLRVTVEPAGGVQLKPGMVARIAVPAAEAVPGD